MLAGVQINVGNQNVHVNLVRGDMQKGCPAKARVIQTGEADFRKVVQELLQLILGGYVAWGPCDDSGLVLFSE